MRRNGRRSSCVADLDTPDLAFPGITLVRCDDWEADKNRAAFQAVVLFDPAACLVGDALIHLYPSLECTLVLSQEANPRTWYDRRHRYLLRDKAPPKLEAS